MNGMGFANYVLGSDRSRRTYELSMMEGVMSLVQNREVQLQANILGTCYTDVFKSGECHSLTERGSDQQNYCW